MFSSNLNLKHLSSLQFIVNVP